MYNIFPFLTITIDIILVVELMFIELWLLLQESTRYELSRVKRLVSRFNREVESQRVVSQVKHEVESRQVSRVNSTTSDVIQDETWHSPCVTDKVHRYY